MAPVFNRNTGQNPIQPKSPGFAGSKASCPHQTFTDVMNLDLSLGDFSQAVHVNDLNGPANVFFHQYHLQIRTFVCSICKHTFFIQQGNNVFLTQSNNQCLTVMSATGHGKKSWKGVESLRTGKAGGQVGRSTSAVRTLCTIIPFNQRR
ncbi:Uncharacterised protein [Paenibacillus macerans]|uniref:Uncharacterized protein n=1 Tax=Paenibacillus macerans TaxID=44252 RepID=A0A090ZF00_PAEMA|nr:hypothetical protein DJ90_409 [Paenibacillus macerans]SUD26890.1 Uncharacterised protein [Paenibacillus macerans]